MRNKPYPVGRTVGQNRCVVASHCAKIRPITPTVDRILPRAVNVIHIINSYTPERVRIGITYRVSYYRRYRIAKRVRIPYQHRCQPRRPADVQFRGPVHHDRGRLSRRAIRCRCAILRNVHPRVATAVAVSKVPGTVSYGRCATVISVGHEPDKTMVRKTLQQSCASVRHGSKTSPVASVKPVFPVAAS